MGKGQKLPEILTSAAGDCQSNAYESMNIPQFIKVDLTEKRLSGTWRGNADPSPDVVPPRKFNGFEHPFQPRIMMLDFGSTFFLFYEESTGVFEFEGCHSRERPSEPVGTHLNRKFSDN